MMVILKEIELREINHIINRLFLLLVGERYVR